MILKRYIASFAIAMMVLMMVLTTGCGREETSSAPSQIKGETPTAQLEANRKDAAKVKDALKGARLAARGLAVAERRIETAKKEARAALGAGATDEQVLAELNGNPSKYPDWKRALADRDELEKKVAQERANGRNAARQLLLEKQGRDASSRHPQTKK